MPKKVQPLTAIWWSVLILALALGAILVPASASTCYGTWFTYYDGPAHTNIVGSKVACPGFPDQVDEDSNGNAVETPWYTTSQVVCPCSGGGGGGGGGEDQDSDEW